jgi:uncharacterized membrane protein YphA (DoxX/SURF4 family)
MNLSVIRSPEDWLRIVALLALAVAFASSGVRGVRGRSVWIPSGSDDPHATAYPDSGTLVQGRWARPVGVVLLLLAAGCVLGALAIWFRFFSPGV